MSKESGIPKEYVMLFIDMSNAKQDLKKAFVDQMMISFNLFTSFMIRDIKIFQLKDFIKYYNIILEARKKHCEKYEKNPEQDLMYRIYWFSTVEARNAIAAKTKGYTGVTGTKNHWTFLGKPYDHRANEST